MNNESIKKKLYINPQQLYAYSTGLLQGMAYQRLYDSLNRVLIPFNLSIPEWKLLGQLHEHGKVKLSELAELLSYDAPMVTKLAKMLEKKELAKRIHDTVDERVKVINITIEGSQLIEKLEPEVKRAMALLLKGITPEELKIYIKVLSTIVNNTQA